MRATNKIDQRMLLEYLFFALRGLVAPERKTRKSPRGKRRTAAAVQAAHAMLYKGVVDAS